MLRHLPVLLLVALLAAGCETAYSRNAGWAYSGSDASLRSEIWDEHVRKMVKEFGSKLASEPAQQKIREDHKAWQGIRVADLDHARDACARETGDSGSKNFWTGRYNELFLACMETRGWSHRQPLSDPL